MPECMKGLGIWPLDPIFQHNVEPSERPVPPTSLCVEGAWAKDAFEWILLTFSLSSWISRGKKRFRLTCEYSVGPRKLPCDLGVQPQFSPPGSEVCPAPL